MKDRYEMLRKTLGLSQHQIGEALGIKQSVYSRYESGKISQPSPEVIDGLRRLGVNIGWLFTGQGEMLAQAAGDRDPNAGYSSSLKSNSQTFDQQADGDRDGGAPSELGERLREVRELARLSQESLAKKVNMSFHTILRYEKGNYVPPPAKLRKIADTLGASIRYLQTGQGKPFERPPETSNGRMLGPAGGPAMVVYFPFIPVKARATFAESYLDAAGSGLDPVGVPAEVAAGLEGKGYVVEVDGDSMEPYYWSGMRLLARKLDQGDWQYATGVHVVIFGSNFFALKRILSNTLRGTGTLSLTSDNPTGGSIEVPEEDIKAIFKIVHVLSAPPR
jgi:transcriptional regulator with XRE-family HTH domain